MYAKLPTVLAACTDFAAMQYAVLIHSSYELCVTFFSLEVDVSGVSCSPLAGLMFIIAFLEMKQAELDLLAFLNVHKKDVYVETES